MTEDEEFNLVEYLISRGVKVNSSYRDAERR